jgi:hypothetical protein
MSEVSLSELGDPDKGFWLRVEACFRSWSMFEDWLNMTRRQIGKFKVYNVGRQEPVV